MVVGDCGGRWWRWEVVVVGGLWTCVVDMCGDVLCARVVHTYGHVLWA